MRRSSCARRPAHVQDGRWSALVPLPCLPEGAGSTWCRRVPGRVVVLFTAVAGRTGRSQVGPTVAATVEGGQIHWCGRRGRDVREPVGLIVSWAR